MDSNSSQRQGWGGFSDRRHSYSIWACSLFFAHCKENTLAWLLLNHGKKALEENVWKQDSNQVEERVRLSCFCVIIVDLLLMLEACCPSTHQGLVSLSLPPIHFPQWRILPQKWEPRYTSASNWPCLRAPSEKAVAPHSSTLAWKIPWTEEPGRLQSMGSRRAGHNWATSLSLFTFTHWRRKWQPTPVFLPEEPQGREAWWAAVYGVAQSRIRLKQLSSSSSKSSLVAQLVKNPPAMQETWVWLIPGLGRSPEKGKGNPLQYSSLENRMDRGT